LLVAQVRRAALLDSSSFEDGVWGQRIEWMSFVSLPQNMVVLVPAAACAALASVLVADLARRRALWSAQLNRVTAGANLVAIGLGTLGVLDVLVQNPDEDGSIAAILTRVGGVMMAIGMIVVSLHVEHSGDGQPPTSPRL